MYGIKNKISLLGMLLVLVSLLAVLSPVPASAQNPPEGSQGSNFTSEEFFNDNPGEPGDLCGADTSGSDPVRTSINIGCRGEGSPIIDMTFAIVRFLSIGVGLVIIGSIVVAGIQYISSKGDPGAVAKAKDRIFHTVLALVIFIFAYAILNYLIPNGVLN